MNDHYKPLELYVEKLKSYFQLINQLEKRNMSYSVVKFEDFVTNQQRVFEVLSPVLDAPSLNFSELVQSTKEKGKDSNFYASYYSNEVWKKDFPEVETIRVPLNDELKSFFGYE